MAVVANISVLLSAKVQSYRSDIGFARQSSEAFGRAAAAAGLNIRDASRAVETLRQRSFELLSTQEKLQAELDAINHLYRSGLIDSTNYAKAVNDLNAAYKSKAAAEAAKDQDAFNNSVQRGTQLLRPQIAAQKEAMTEYKRTVAALNALQQSGTAQRLGITSEEIEAKRREAFLVGQAKFQGKETPAQIQEQTRKATEAAAASVDKFNQRFISARQALRNTLVDLRGLREQAELAGKPLDIESQKRFIEQAKETFRRDSGLADRIRREQAAQEANNQAVERGIKLLDKNFAARQRLGAQLRDLQAAAKADPDRFGGQKLETARRQAFEAYRAETQKSTQLAAASVDKFNERFVTARQRLRETINELRVMRESAAATGKVLDKNAQAQFVKKAVTDFRRDSGLDDKLREQAKAHEEANRAAARGIELVDREVVANAKRRQQLLQQLADINAARKAYAGLDVRKFASATRGVFDELNALREGRESPAAIAERKAQELAANKARIEKENITAIKATMTAEQARAAEYERINADIVNGLNAEAAARRRLAADAAFNKSTGVDARLKIEADLIAKYNESIARGTQIARPAKVATDEYRKTVKDLGRALNAAKINQEEYNLARLQAQRIRTDNSVSPIIQSGIQQVAPYRQVLQQITRNLIDMRAAVQANKITQAEYNQALTQGVSPAQQLINAQNILIARYKAGKIGVQEFVASLRMAKAELITQPSLIARMTNALTVLRTVAIGMAGAQLYGAIFQGISDGFAFEPKIRRAIALFGEVTKAEEAALRQVTFASTYNNVPLLDRVQVLEELAKDGVAADVAIKSLDKTLQFASSSGLPAQDAVTKVSELLNAYKLNTGDATEDTERLSQIMDLLTYTSNNTAATVEQVAEGMLRAAPQANILGIGLREVAAGMFAFSEGGRQGEVAGNELNIALRDLAQNAVQNKQAFADMGITVFENDGSFNGLLETVASLTAAMEQLTPVEKTLALETLGVTQKGANFQQQLILMNDSLQNAKVSFEETNGAVEKLHKGSMTELIALTNSLRTGFAYIVNSTIVEWLEQLAKMINNSSREMRLLVVQSVTGLVGFVAGLRAAAAAVAFLTTAVRLYRSGLLSVAAVQTFLVALAGPKGWAIIAVAAGIAAASVWGITYAWDELENTFDKSKALTDAADAVDRLGLAATSGRNDLIALRTAATDVFNALQTQFNNEGFTALNDAFDSIRSEIASASASGIKEAQESIQQLNVDVTAFFQQNRENISEAALASYFKDLEAKIRNVGKAMKSVDVTQLKALREELTKIQADVQSPLEKAVQELNQLSRIREAKIGLTPVIERRKLNKVLDELTGAVESRLGNASSKFNVAAEIRGSAAEFSSRVTVRSDSQERSETREFHYKSLRLGDAQTKSLGDIISILEEQLTLSRQRETQGLGED